MKILITAGPTQEPIDPVRFIGNRSSGKGGAALANAALKAGHSVTLIVGPVTVDMPQSARRINVQTAAEMLSATIAEFPGHDLLILAAAVADYRPKTMRRDKLPRHGPITIECEPTEDIAAAAGNIKKAHQRTVGFSLESEANLNRSREKLLKKKLDLIVYNPTSTLNSDSIEPILIYPDGRTEPFPSASKGQFADILISRAVDLWIRT